MGELVGKFETELPDCLPILGYGLFSRGPERPVAAKRDGDKSGLLLHALLSKVLLTFAIDFEKESDLSLAISANVMRVLNQEGMRLKDLAIMTGVSREAISVALGILLEETDRRCGDEAVGWTVEDGSPHTEGQRSAARVWSIAGQD